MPLRCLILLLGLTVGSQPIIAEPAPTTEHAWLRLQQRDFVGVQALLPSLRSEHPAEAEVLALHLAYRANEEFDETALEALQARYPDDAWLQFRAGQLWLRRGREASWFAQRGYIKRYIAATLRASELASAEPRLLVEAGIAVGQPSIFGGDPDRQTEFVAKLATIDNHYHLIAKMDLLQNQQDEPTAQAMIAKVSNMMPTQLLVISRAAHLAWTFDAPALAQQLFLQACEQPQKLEQEEYWARWSDACFNAASLAEAGYGERTLTAKAVQQFLNRAAAYDPDRAELVQLLQQWQQPTDH